MHGELMKTPIKTVTVAKLYLDQGYPTAAIRLLNELVEGDDAPPSALELLDEAKQVLRQQRAQAMADKANGKPDAPPEGDPSRSDVTNQERIFNGPFGSLRRIRRNLKSMALKVVEHAARQALRRLGRLIERIEENRRGL